MSESDGGSGVPGLRVGHVTDAGRERVDNQDAVTELRTEFGHLLFVADGMGGHAGGQRASGLAVEAALDTFAGSDDFFGTTASMLRRVLESANKAIHDGAEESPDLKGMGSTGVAAVVRADGAYLAHVGDSRAYLLRAGGIARLTRDHTVVQRMLDDGLLGPAQAAGHPDASVLAKALGRDSGVEVELYSTPVPLMAGDRILLCSDGLYDVVEDPDIATAGIADSPAEAAQRLVDMANAAGGPDNITVLIAEVATDAPKDAPSQLPWILGLPAPIGAVSQRDVSPSGGLAARPDFRIGMALGAALALGTALLFLWGSPSFLPLFDARCEFQAGETAGAAKLVCTPRTAGPNALPGSGAVPKTARKRLNLPLQRAATPDHPRAGVRAHSSPRPRPPTAPPITPARSPAKTPTDAAAR